MLLAQVSGHGVENLLIVDFGSQVTKLIARRVRESGVYSEVHPYNRVDEALLEKFDPKAVILSGGPSSVIGTGTPRADDAIWSLDVPVLGICYGQQTMCTQLGGAVEASDEQEFGRADLEILRMKPVNSTVYNFIQKSCIPRMVLRYLKTLRITSPSSKVIGQCLPLKLIQA